MEGRLFIVKECSAGVEEYGFELGAGTAMNHPWVSSRSQSFTSWLPPTEMLKLMNLTSRWPIGEARTPGTRKANQARPKHFTQSSHYDLYAAYLLLHEQQLHALVPQ